MKTKVIILYGPMAVGKLTIGKKLSDETGVKLAHNHLINDMVFSLFERGTQKGSRVLEETRYSFYTHAVDSEISFIMTHAYSHNYVSPTGQTDPEYLQQLESRFREVGAETFFIHLKASNEKLLQRVVMPSRKKYKKLVDIEIMKEYLSTKDFNTSAEVANQLIIDTSDLDIEQIVLKIRTFTGL